MPSPFPGMDPYLEGAGVWPDFHARFLVHLGDYIGPRLGPNYVALIETALYVQDRPPPAEPVQFAVADALVSQGDAGGGTAVAVAPAVVSAATPATRGRVPLPGRRPQRRVVIRDRVKREVVTVIELLSPSNKTGAGRAAYLAKRRRVLRSQASLVEIDLLRGGERMPVLGVPVEAYSVLVSRPTDRPAVDVWPVPIRGELPVIPIPLRPGEAEPTVELRVVFDAAYDGAQYARLIYAAPPDPPLSADDAAWAAGLLAPAQGG